MKWIAAKVTFDTRDRELATELVADIFTTLDLKGVLVEDPEMEPELDWEQGAFNPPAVTGYFADTPNLTVKCRALESALRWLEKTVGITTRLTYTRIDEQDWAEAWKDHFWPQRITDTIVVKPSWRDYSAKPQEIVLEIDPGMAFGTGTHPTTALCMRMIQDHLRPGDSFLDVGTGSGILMIAAAKLGAATLLGIDHDEVAVRVAEQNLRANGVDRFRLLAGHLVDKVKQPFDVVTANILAEVILALLPHLTAVLTPGGRFICSGITGDNGDAVLAGLRALGLTVIQVLEDADWLAIAARRSRAVVAIPSA